MQRPLLTILIFMSACIILHARYGETVDQLETRFGKANISPIKSFSDVIYYFNKNGTTITTYMINAKCERISYNNNKGFKDEEIMTLLELNKQNSLWAPIVKPRRFDGKKDSLPSKCWQSEDLKLYAEKYGSATLVIFSKLYLEKEQQYEKKLQEEKEKTKNASKVEGF